MALPCSNSVIRFTVHLLASVEIALFLSLLFLFFGFGLDVTDFAQYAYIALFHIYVKCDRIVDCASYARYSSCKSSECCPSKYVPPR